MKSEAEFLAEQLYQEIDVTRCLEVENDILKKALENIRELGEAHISPRAFGIADRALVKVGNLKNKKTADAED